MSRTDPNSFDRYFNIAERGTARGNHRFYVNYLFDGIDFRGKTMRAVVEEASAQGFPVMLNGSGIARMQEPPPGSVLRPGERIRVQFAR